MTDVPPKVPRESSDSAPPEEADVNTSATPLNGRLLLWLGVIGAIVCGLWWLTSGGEPPLGANPHVVSDRGLTPEGPGPSRQLDLSRHLRKRPGPHLFDDKRPNWDPARLRTPPGVGLSRRKLADAAAPP